MQINNNKTQTLKTKTFSKKKIQTLKSYFIIMNKRLKNDVLFELSFKKYYQIII